MYELTNERPCNDYTFMQVMTKCGKIFEVRLIDKGESFPVLNGRYKQADSTCLVGYIWELDDEQDIHLLDWAQVEVEDLTEYDECVKKLCESLDIANPELAM